MAVSTRSRKNQPVMNPQFDMYSAQPASSKPFDEAASAAELAAFLDLSSFTAAEPAPIAVPDFGVQSSFLDAFSAAPASTGALRPVDDSLLDSPLDLELSPASFGSSASSFAGSPFDFGSSTDYTSPLMSSYGSPLVGDVGCVSMAGDLPSLFAPAPSAFSMLPTLQTTPQWSPQDVVISQQQQQPVSTPMDEDVKPLVSPALASVQPGASLLFDFPAPAPASIEVSPAPVAAPAPAPSPPAKRKTVAQLKKEAALLVEEKAFKKDQFKGFRNTKKPMIDYDAPTLPKNYLTESATSRKRGGSAKAQGSSSAKRARTASVTPAPAAVELPPTAAEPIDADQLNEEQLSAIELKRRSNTLAARRSRMRKAEHLKSLEDQIAALKAINEHLVMENQRLKEKCGEADA
ncbi:hypothetical protein JCM10213_005637 [Rhodosporidiobolus nylandii]